VPARDYRLTTNATAFSIAAPQRGLVVLHETWVPDDFRVTLNGQPAQVLRVNHAFKGVWLPSPGDYRVEFRYAPPRLRWALAGSALGALGLIVLIVVHTRRRDSVPAP
jgi:hypothetical protein